MDQELNPFSPEQAMLTWKNNREASVRLRAELKAGQESGAPVREQLLCAAEIIGRLTDNTIFLPILRRELEKRDRA